MCGKNRFLVEGKSICKKCNEEGNIPCPECGQLYPAGQGRRCSNCYSLDLLDRKLKLSLSGLESVASQFVFRKYSEWLIRQYTPQKAAVVINKHFNFFQEVDQKWGAFPPYETLLKHYGAEGLRRHRTPIRFLDESKIIRIDQSKKLNSSESRRIEQIINEFNGTPQTKLVLNHYRTLLLGQTENKKLSIRTIRFYLRAAADLLESASAFPPSQNDIQHYLSKKPGQKASLTRFISHVNSEWVWDTKLCLPKTKHRKQQAGKLSAEKKLVRLLKTAGENASYDDEEILSAAIEYYHGVSRKILKTIGFTLRKENVSDGIFVTIQGVDYWLPPLAKHLAK